MNKLTFNVSINAPAGKVWDVLWTDATYRVWTTVFHEGSRMQVAGLSKGEKVLFTDGDGNGMVSRIADVTANKYMSFEHLGMIKDGVEDTTSDSVKAWAGSHENYILEDNNGTTTLSVELDMNDEMKDYFNNTFPKALAKVKELAEQ